MKPLNLFTATILGIVFGAGLALSGMTDPKKVLGFLNILGPWDPTLMVVMASALAVSLPGYQWFLRNKEKPLLESKFFLPGSKSVDNKLLIGAVLFGAGWGLFGVCPGPALVSLIYGQWQVWLFVGAMLFGMWISDLYNTHSAEKTK